MLLRFVLLCLGGGGCVISSRAFWTLWQDVWLAHLDGIPDRDVGMDTLMLCACVRARSELELGGAPLHLPTWNPSLSLSLPFLVLGGPSISGHTAGSHMSGQHGRGVARRCRCRSCLLLIGRAVHVRRPERGVPADAVISSCRRVPERSSTCGRVRAVWGGKRERVKGEGKGV